jgi:hypothetical protein
MARITGIDPVTKGYGGLHNTALLVVQIKRLVPDRRCLKGRGLRTSSDRDAMARMRK